MAEEIESGVFAVVEPISGVNSGVESGKGGGIGSGSSLRAALTIDRLPLEGRRPNSFSVSVLPMLLAEEGEGDLDDCGFGGRAKLLAIGGGRFALYAGSLGDEGRRKCVCWLPKTADSAACVCSTDELSEGLKMLSKVT